MEADLDQHLRRLLTAWGKSATIAGRITGGYRNSLWEVHVGGSRYAARLSNRVGAALDWEIYLLRYLHEAGLVVPEVLATQDGRPRVDGLILFSWLDGQPPSSERDWRLVARELVRLHDLTRQWPQRPAFLSSRALLEENVGGDVHLDLMPPETVVRVRDAWRALEGEPMSVVHGDPGASNIRIHAGRAGFIDWDEARVDVSLFDLAALLLDQTPSVGDARVSRARRAAIAWEAANGWVVEPEYARRRLAELD